MHRRRPFFYAVMYIYIHIGFKSSAIACPFFLRKHVNTLQFSVAYYYTAYYFKSSDIISLYWPEGSWHGARLYYSNITRLNYRSSLN